MRNFHYVKASDIDFDFCFLEISIGKNEPPFMDVRISDDRKLSFFVYGDQKEVIFSPKEWIEVYEKALAFYKSEIENEDASDDWFGQT